MQNTGTQADNTEARCGNCGDPLNDQGCERCQYTAALDAAISDLRRMAENSRP